LFPLRLCHTEDSGTNTLPPLGESSLHHSSHTGTRIGSSAVGNPGWDAPAQKLHGSRRRPPDVRTSSQATIWWNLQHHHRIATHDRATRNIIHRHPHSRRHSIIAVSATYAVLQDSFIPRRRDTRKRVRYGGRLQGPEGPTDGEGRQGAPP